MPASQPQAIIAKKGALMLLFTDEWSGSVELAGEQALDELNLELGLSLDAPECYEYRMVPRQNMSELLEVSCTIPSGLDTAEVLHIVSARLNPACVNIAQEASHVLVPSENGPLHSFFIPTDGFITPREELVRRIQSLSQLTAPQQDPTFEHGIAIRGQAIVGSVPDFFGQICDELGIFPVCGYADDDSLLAS